MGATWELLHLFADPHCPDHGSRTVYDHNLRSLRCAWCGHRVRKDGEPVTATRHLSPLLWPKEVGGRAWAKQTRGKSQPQARGLSSR